MSKAKLQELIVSGKFQLFFRAVLLTFVFVSSLIGPGIAFAEPDPGPVGG